MLKSIATMTVTGLLAGSAWAGISYNFTNITNNNPYDAATGEAQFSVEVIDAGGMVEFLFRNSGPRHSSMVQLYWDDSGFDPVLDDLESWSTSSNSWFGPNFNGGSAKPRNLPGGNEVDFDTDFSIEPINWGGKSRNGVNRGEDVSIFFTATNGYDSVISAMDSGDLRIGLHAQAFECGGSESFVSNGRPSTGIPTPTAAFAGLVLLGAVGMRRRRA